MSQIRDALCCHGTQCKLNVGVQMYIVSEFSQNLKQLVAQNAFYQKIERELCHQIIPIKWYTPLLCTTKFECHP